MQKTSTQSLPPAPRRRSPSLTESSSRRCERPGRSLQLDGRAAASYPTGPASPWCIRGRPRPRPTSDAISSSSRTRSTNLLTWSRWTDPQSAYRYGSTSSTRGANASGGRLALEGHRQTLRHHRTTLRGEADRDGELDTARPAQLAASLAREAQDDHGPARSEERRVGKEGRSRW